MSHQFLLKFLKKKIIASTILYIMYFYIFGIILNLMLTLTPKRASLSGLFSKT